MDLSLDELIRTKEKKSSKHNRSEKNNRENRNSRSKGKSSRKFRETSQEKVIYDDYDKDINRKSLKHGRSEKNLYRENRNSHLQGRSPRKFKEPSQDRVIYKDKDIHGIDSIIDEMMDDEGDNFRTQSSSLMSKVVHPKMVKRSHMDAFEDESDYPLRKTQKPRLASQDVPITKLLLKNLAFSVDKDDLDELFQEFKGVLKVVLDIDSNKQSMGSAYALFSSRSEALRAVSTYNEVPLDDKPMHIAIKKSNKTVVKSKPKVPSRKSVFSRISRPPSSSTVFSRISENSSSSSALHTRDTNKSRHRSLSRDDDDCDLYQKKRVDDNNRKEHRSEYHDFDNPDLQKRQHPFSSLDDYRSKKENRNRHDQRESKQNRSERRPPQPTAEDLDAELEEIVNPYIDTDVFGH